MVIGNAYLLISELNSYILPIVFTIRVWSSEYQFEDIVQSLLYMCLYGVCSLIVT